MDWLQQYPKTTVRNNSPQYGEYFSLDFPTDYPCAKSNDVTIGDLRTLDNCITKLEGLTSNSASATDIYRITTNPNFRYNGEMVTNVFMKVFITSNFKDRYALSEELLYEFLVYMDKIKKIVNLNICPFFIKVLGGNLRVPSQYLTNFLQRHTRELALTPNIRDRFVSNINKIINGEQGRPSITENVFLYNRRTINPATNRQTATRVDATDLNNKENIINDMTYGYFMTEGTKDGCTNSSFLEWMTTDRTRINDLTLNLTPTMVKRDFLVILLQIAIACKTMFMGRFCHNDLHPGNVRIETHPNPKPFGYIIQDKAGNTGSFFVNSNIRCHIYDFDRGYIESVNNPILQGTAAYSQSNHLIELRDFIKLSNHLLHIMVGKGINVNILEIMMSHLYMPSGGMDFTQFRKTKTAFLQDITTNAPMNDEVDFKIFYNLDTIIGSIYRAYVDISARLGLPHNVYEGDFDVYVLRNNFFDANGNILSQQLHNYYNEKVKMEIAMTLISPAVP